MSIRSLVTTTPSYQHGLVECSRMSVRRKEGQACQYDREKRRVRRVNKSKLNIRTGSNQRHNKGQEPKLWSGEIVPVLQSCWILHEKDLKYFCFSPPGNLRVVLGENWRSDNHLTACKWIRGDTWSSTSDKMTIRERREREFYWIKRGRRSTSICCWKLIFLWSCAYWLGADWRLGTFLLIIELNREQGDILSVKNR